MRAWNEEVLCTVCRQYKNAPMPPWNAVPQCDDATRALAIASSDATGTNANVLPAVNLVGRWFSKPISPGISPSAAARRSAVGRVPFTQGLGLR